MAKAKTASKNNPTTREQAKEFFFNGQKVKPVRLVSEKSIILAAEYDGSGSLVCGSDGEPLPWDMVKHSS